MACLSLVGYGVYIADVSSVSPSSEQTNVNHVDNNNTPFRPLNVHYSTQSLYLAPFSNF